jgi:hypothetical protein
MAYGPGLRGVGGRWGRLVAVVARRGLVALLALAALGGPVWDKAPEKWSLGDVFHILQDSPWCPAEVKVEARPTSQAVNAQTGMIADSPINSQEANPVPAVQLSRSKPAPAVPVLWWSSKVVRLAELRKKQLQGGADSGEGALSVETLPDFVLVIEESEAYRILHDAKEDLHDSVFLEIAGGGTIDLESVKFVEESGQEEARVEFHFPREVDGQATLDENAGKVIFHCRAEAKTPRPTENNVLSFRAEFKPKMMKVRGVADL